MLGQRIKKLREERGMTQQNLADMLGVSQQAVAKWESEKEKAEPDSITMIKISNIFQVSLDYLLGRTNVRTPIETIAAHHDSEDWTEEELEEIEAFKEFVRMRRQKKKTQD